MSLGLDCCLISATVAWNSGAYYPIPLCYSLFKKKKELNNFNSISPSKF